MSIFRRAALPDDVRRVVPPGDRALAAAALDGGGWVVATRELLCVVHDAADPAVRRAWSDVDRAGFDPREAELTVEWVDGAPPLTLRLASPVSSRVPQVLRERVQSSVVLAEVLTLAHGRRVKVAVRRGRGGTLFSQVQADPGVDLDDPEVLARVDAAEARVRSASGLPR
ncbi:hypothetical protein CLV28_1454 [Sediminihabitans luteus]|uniref:Uncharacterized protein n=1 Tax=Sediminihabitans luteus TaxID=1138585 RepID=A0A2M9CPY1_9CELL|nr:hypothetical protein [Sediminihabitans luteus]PJJ73969.1 hypothetical protein CLV28_1454 [Sediminihabitans luteus]GII98118.1 hypothetical protein Slu03_04960 [Sediminihabitans luteus]